MEIVEKLPNEIANVVYSFVGKHPIAQLYEHDAACVFMPEFYDSEEPFEADDILDVILYTRRRRKIANFPSHQIGLMLNSWTLLYRAKQQLRIKKKLPIVSFPKWFSNYPNNPI